MDGDICFVERGGSVPSEADLSLTLTDEAMAPFFPKGTTVYIDATRPPDEFQAGIFYYNGRIFCRQWCEDMTGTLHLLPANPAMGKQCVSVPAEEHGKCLCLGAVLSEETLSEPIYY